MILYSVNNEKVAKSYVICDESYDENLKIKKALAGKSPLPFFHLPSRWLAGMVGEGGIG